MNKEKRIRRLTWNFFIEQKVDELKDFFSKVLVVGLVLWIFFGWMFSMIFFIAYNEYPSFWLLLLMKIILAAWLISIWSAIVYYFVEWLNKNWRLANRRAIVHYDYEKSRRKRK